MNARTAKLFALVDVGEKMISGEVDPVAGSREIAHLSPGGDEATYAAYADQGPFAPFISIDLQADDYDVWIGDRTLWSDEFVQDRDLRYAEYARSLQPEIAEHCRALLAVITPWLRACPVCGFGTSKPPYDAAGEPSFEQCRSCGFEFGVTENAGYDVEEWRRRWRAEGMPFRHPPVPSDWDPAVQLAAAGIA